MVDLLQILHVVLVEKPLCDAATVPLGAHVDRLLDLGLLTSLLEDLLLGIVRALHGQALVIVRFLSISTVPSVFLSGILSSERGLESLIQIPWLLIR